MNRAGVAALLGAAGRHRFVLAADAMADRPTATIELPRSQIGR